MEKVITSDFDTFSVEKAETRRNLEIYNNVAIGKWFKDKWKDNIPEVFTLENYAKE